MDRENPVSQSVEAVIALLKSQGWSGEKPPASVKMSDTCFLVLSAAGQEYYTVTQRGCSCPWPASPCKHQRRFLKMTPTIKIATMPAGPFRPLLENL